MKRRSKQERQARAVQYELALEAGIGAADACADKAEAETEFDPDTAKHLILARLKADQGEAMSCEDLVDWCREHGQTPHLDKAFGSIFKALRKQKLIERTGYGPRRKGHGAHGASWWRLMA
jgi:hypothetical protein